MIPIIHKVNDIGTLNKLPNDVGIEIDVRSNGNELILSHDIEEVNDKFEEFLNTYDKKLIVANIKESGIEDKVVDQLENKNIKDYFLLDVEFPYIFKCLKNRQKNIAIRFSENEPIETAKLFKNNFKWLWIDTVSKLPLNKKNLKIVNKFKSCLVCPERWGRPNQIKSYKKRLKSLNFLPDAVMTSLKYAEKWLI